jgi:hypothetical protein
MTSRAKPVTRPRKDRLEAGERRNLLMTVGFGVAIGFALLMLLAAVGKTWYDDHMATMLSVNGQSVSRDFYRQANAVERFRLDQEEAQVRALVAAGRLSATDGDQQITEIGTRRENVDDATNTKIIDGLVQTDLAKEQGVPATPAQIDEAWAAEATQPEARNAFLISVSPGVAEGATTSTQAEIDAARKKAEEIKAQLDAGKSWDEVAKTNGTGESIDGSIGWITADSTAADTNTIKAMFTLPSDGYTDVIETTDGRFDIGRVKEIEPAKVDPDFSKKVSDAGVDQGVYRTLLGYEVVAKNLTDKVVSAAVDQPSVQRLVSEIRLNAAQGTGDEVRARHVLISPGGDPSKASEVAETDPAWTKAKDDAQRIYEEIKAGKVTFEDAAKQSSNDSGSASDGGLLPWLTQDSVVKEFGDAIFTPGLKEGDVLAPVKTQFGWHIIEYVGRRPPPDQLIETIRVEAMAPGADFGELAKKYSDAEDASTGGDLGWVAKLQLPAEKETAIFAAPAGGISEVLSAQDGFYIFKIDQESTRLPDAAQASLIRGGGFDRWYTPLRAEATIEQLATPLQVLGTPQPQP